MSIKIKDRAEMANVAAIASNNDEIGDLLAGAMEQAGKDGVITVDEVRACPRKWSG